MNLQNFYNELVNNNGASYNITTGILNPNSGYFVSLPKRELQLQKEEFNEEVLKVFLFICSSLFGKETKKPLFGFKIPVVML